MRCTPGYLVSGAGLVLCSQHALVCRNGVADLKKGEQYVFALSLFAFLIKFRYCVIDYIIFSVLMGIMLPWIVLTYDIGCQWSKNMWKRNAEYPEAMQINPDTRVDVAIPSWHINGHGQSCCNDFCLNYLVGAGRTCSEDVETSWSHTNPLAPSIREMGPAARHDTLNDHWNGWNFHKIVGFRAYFSVYCCHVII